MKISNITSTAATTAVNSDRKASNSNADKKTGATGAAEVDSSTQVELSPAASLLSSASADPTFDAEKVKRIAQQIEQGNFKPNPYAIADKLIGNAQELLARTSSH